MNVRRVACLVASVVVAVSSTATAQSTDGTISGRVADTQGLPASGVTVTVESPNLQGARTGMTSTNGDYLITLLPPGPYTVSFELSGFASQSRTVRLAPTQLLRVDVILGPAPLEQAVEVVGGFARPLLHTTQVATSFSQELIATLPTTRDVHASMLMAPSVHPTGPSGNYSIAGAMSYESLFLVDGVTVNDNLRGQPHELYIEDAIQETTIATAGVSAEYGRFGGGVVNVITKSGGNTVSGSLRTTLVNDRWRTYTPFELTSMAADPQHRDTRLNDTVPTYEFTLGGPVVNDRLWVFAAGRFQSQESARTLAVTNIPYAFREDTRRYEAKATYSVGGAHRIRGTFTKGALSQTNSTFQATSSMDLNSLYDAKRPTDLFALNYDGALLPDLFVETRYAVRNETLRDIGATTRDRINGTLLVDLARGGTRYWSATFCGVCEPEERDNGELFLKGSYFASTGGWGSHTLVFGYDRFSDRRLADNHQSGSDYVIFGTTSIIQGTGEGQTIYPQFLGDDSTTIVWRPILVSSEGSDFRTHSGFVSDTWRPVSRVTADLGLRYDKNHGVNSAGEVVTTEGAFSPRVGVAFDLLGDGRWSMTGSVARYVTAISNTIADSSSPGGNADFYQFAYRGPSINANPAAPMIPTAEALQQVFDWFDANGGSSLPLAGPPIIRGVTPQIGQSLASPSVFEYAVGMGRELGSRAGIRADFTYRTYRDFYASRTDTSTGQVTDSAGRPYDLTLIENTDQLERRYTGLSVQSHYRFGSRSGVGGNYTLSRTWGSIEGETATGGPSAASALQYPEYKEASWNYPEGDLSVDQRHRARLWADVEAPRVPGLTLGVMQTLESGVPYGAVAPSGVDPRPYATNPGYVTPPGGPSTAYYYTDADTFRTEGQRRTDLALNYSSRLGLGNRAQFFVQAQVVNLFNQFQLCGCGGTVFQNGGAVNRSTIDQSVLTSVTNRATYKTFNPFTTTPVRGVNWDYGPNFGKALNRFSYTTPRTIRVSFGVRF